MLQNKERKQISAKTIIIAVGGGSFGPNRPPLENIEDFDEVFEELYDKYKGRGNMPPEAKLLMSLVGSGFMFHMSNSFFRSKMSNMTPDDIFRNIHFFAAK